MLNIAYISLVFFSTIAIAMMNHLHSTLDSRAIPSRYINIFPFGWWQPTRRSPSKCTNQQQKPGTPATAMAVLYFCDRVVNITRPYAVRCVLISQIRQEYFILEHYGVVSWGKHLYDGNATHRPLYVPWTCYLFLQKKGLWLWFLLLSNCCRKSYGT